MDGAAEIDWRWFALTLTRSPAQKPAHKDLERNDQNPVITLKATYAPVSNRAGSRSVLDKMFALFIKSGTMTMYQLIR